MKVSSLRGSKRTLSPTPIILSRSEDFTSILAMMSSWKKEEEEVSSISTNSFRGVLHMTGKMASTCPAIQMAEVAMLQACCRNKPVTRPSSQAGVHLQKTPTGNPTLCHLRLQPKLAHARRISFHGGLPLPPALAQRHQPGPYMNQLPLRGQASAFQG